MDERLGKIRVRKQDVEACLADLERANTNRSTLKATTSNALACLARFREVLEEGTLEHSADYLDLTA